MRPHLSRVRQGGLSCWFYTWRLLGDCHADSSLCLLSLEQALLPFSVLVSQAPAAVLTAAFCAAALKA